MKKCSPPHWTTSYCKIGVKILDSRYPAVYRVQVKKILFVRRSISQSQISPPEVLKVLIVLYTEAELRAMRARHSFAEKGVVFNLCCDFASTIAVGLDRRRQEIEERCPAGEFRTAVLREIDAVLELAGRYCAAARTVGRKETAAMLEKIPHRGAE